MGALFDFLLSGGGGSAGNSPTLNGGDRSAHPCQSGAIEGGLPRYLVTRSISKDNINTFRNDVLVDLVIRAIVSF